MAENAQTVRGIDYKATFPFVHLFRGFRLAIDPSKLGLALVALILLYVGGRLMDSLWPGKYRAMTDEIHEYSRSTGNFAKTRLDAADARAAELKLAMSSIGKPDENPSIGKLKSELRKLRDDEIRAANETYDKLEADKKNDDAAKARDARIKEAHSNYATALRRADSLAGEGLFIHFISYEIEQVDFLAGSVVNLDVEGTLGSLKRFFAVAPCWAISQHPVFFSIFFVLYILLMAICGGAISRICAVQVARDEKISVRQALRFSTGKVLSFTFAPLIPIIIIVVIGLALGVLSMFMSVPVVGGIWSVVVGVLFFVALLAGLVMTLTALGLIGGGHLMYPTIAVEGTDSFDAVSRSFSYLYARPWHLIWYSIVALLYGAITYLFVRFFLYILLVLVHTSVGLFMWGEAKDGADLMNTLWPAPAHPMKLSFIVDYANLGPVQSVGAFFIAFWVYLALALLGAYAISLYFSSSTIIYYLMRKEVDATALDEVYLEPSDDEFADAGVSTDTPLQNDAPAHSPEAPQTDLPPGNA